MLFDSFDLNPVEGVTASNQRTHKQIGARADTTMSMFNVFCRGCGHSHLGWLAASQKSFEIRLRKMRGPAFINQLSVD
jgi:hypothetical protein